MVAPISKDSFLPVANAAAVMMQCEIVPTEQNPDKYFCESLKYAPTPTPNKMLGYIWKVESPLVWVQSRPEQGQKPLILFVEPSGKGRVPTDAELKKEGLDALIK